MASTPSTRTIPKLVSFEQPLYLNSHTQCDNGIFSNNSHRLLEDAI
jgi:hypothetical protein